MTIIDDRDHKGRRLVSHMKASIDALEHDHWQQAGCTPCVLTRQGLLVLKENSYTTIELDCVFPVLHGKNGEDGTDSGTAGDHGHPICGLWPSEQCHLHGQGDDTHHL